MYSHLVSRSLNLQSNKVTVLLDGGGIHGISTLFILQALMALVNEIIRSERDQEVQHEYLEPHDIFNLVAGTSTGGLIAIMLEKLGMTVQEGITAYRDMSVTIFGRKYLRARATGGLGPARYSGSRLEGCVKTLIRKYRIDENLAMIADRHIDKTAW